MIEGKYTRLSEDSEGMVMLNVAHHPTAIAVSSGDFLDESTTTWYVRRPPTCTIEPASAYEEDYGMYTCSNCGEVWQFMCDGPLDNGWTCCPRCRATIEGVGDGR